LPKLGAADFQLRDHCEKLQAARCCVEPSTSQSNCVHWLFVKANWLAMRNITVSKTEMVWFALVVEIFVQRPRVVVRSTTAPNVVQWAQYYA